MNHRIWLSPNHGINWSRKSLVCSPNHRNWSSLFVLNSIGPVNRLCSCSNAIGQGCRMYIDMGYLLVTRITHLLLISCNQSRRFTLRKPQWNLVSMMSYFTLHEELIQFFTAFHRCLRANALDTKKEGILHQRLVLLVVSNYWGF